MSKSLTQPAQRVHRVGTDQNFDPMFFSGLRGVTLYTLLINKAYGAFMHLPMNALSPIQLIFRTPDARSD